MQQVVGERLMFTDLAGQRLEESAGGRRLRGHELEERLRPDGPDVRVVEGEDARRPRHLPERRQFAEEAGCIESRVQDTVPVRRLGADLDAAGDQEEDITVGVPLVTQIRTSAEAMNGALRGEPVELLAGNLLEEGRAGHDPADL